MGWKHHIKMSNGHDSSQLDFGAAYFGRDASHWPISSTFAKLRQTAFPASLRSSTSTTVMRLATITSPLSRLWRWAEAPSEFDGCWSSCTASFVPMQGDVNWPRTWQNWNSISKCYFGVKCLSRLALVGQSNPRHFHCYSLAWQNW